MVDRGFVSLVGDLGLRDAAEVRARLLTAVTEAEEVIVDVSELAGADVTILQVLASAHKSAARLGKPIRLVGINAALSSVLERTGFVGADGAALAAEGAFWTGGVAS